MEQIAIDDISNLLYSISIKYNLRFRIFCRDRYLPIIHMKKKRFDLNELIKIKIKIIKIKIQWTQIQQNNPRAPITPNQSEQHLRCNARIWANGFVHFDNTTNTWQYGKQCARFKFSTTDFCICHLKKNPHGNFFKPPPHPHFQKFKDRNRTQDSL